MIFPAELGTNHTERTSTRCPEASSFPRSPALPRAAREIDSSGSPARYVVAVTFVASVVNRALFTPATSCVRR